MADVSRGFFAGTGMLNRRPKSFVGRLKIVILLTL